MSSSRKSLCLGLAIGAAMTATAIFGWQKLEIAREIPKRAAFFEDFGKLDFSIPIDPKNQPHD